MLVRSVFDWHIADEELCRQRITYSRAILGIGDLPDRWIPRIQGGQRPMHAVCFPNEFVVS